MENVLRAHCYTLYLSTELFLELARGVSGPLDRATAESHQLSHLILHHRTSPLSCPSTCAFRTQH